ncbi:MAG: hypothetical protein QGH60_02460 [Phycisphaerae bacterium]|nr:hypothetical protein [Phycisphaerae bacterium]
MSTDYQYDVLIGFTVLEDKLYDRENGSRWSCEHAEKQHSQDPSAKHCIECGKGISKVEESRLVLKPEFAAVIEDDWFHNIGWVGDLAGVKIWLTQYYVDNGDEVCGVYFVGVEVASFYHREDLGVRQEGIPRIPSESEVAEFLNASGIPFDPESWGLWKIGTAH